MKLSQFLLSSALAFSACSPEAATPPAAAPAAPAKASVPLAPAVGKASPHLPAALRHLDFGGEVFSYYDVDGEVDGMLDGLSSIYQGASEIARAKGSVVFNISRQTLGEIARQTGALSPKALGLSSVSLGDGRYLNKTLLLMPGGPTGVFKVLGGPAHPFASLKLAPANTQVLVEADVDGLALVELVRSLTSEVGGRAVLDQIDGMLNRPVAPFPGAPTGRRVAEALKTRLTLIVALDAAKKFQLEEDAPMLPQPDAVVLLEGVAPVLLPLLREMAKEFPPEIKITDTPERFLIEFGQVEPRLPGFSPVVELDLKSGQLRAATTRAFLDACMAGGGEFAKGETFRQFAGNVPTEGNALICLNLSVAKEMVASLDKAVPESDRAAFESAKGFLNTLAGSLAKPSLTVLSNLPDGVTITSNAPYSHKNQLVGLIPVALGLLLMGAL